MSPSARVLGALYAVRTRIRMQHLAPPMHHPTKREIGQVCPRDGRVSLPLLIPTQHFLFGFHGHHVSDDIRTLICDYYLGCVDPLTPIRSSLTAPRNVILMKRNVQSVSAACSSSPR